MTLVNRSIAAGAALGLALFSPAALAGPLADAAGARIRQIADGDVAALTAAYASDAGLHWIGGPLDGDYHGEAIAETWRRFAAASAGLDVSVGPLIESANPQGATIVAPIIFTGARTFMVRYVLVYRDVRIVDEIWQIDPAMERTW